MAMRDAVAALVLLVCSSCANLRTAIDLPEQCTRLVVGSCVARRDDALWDKISEFHPDAVLLTGDTVYHTAQSMSSVNAARELYASVYESPSFARVRESTPILAAIDDHDFGSDNSDSSNPWASETVPAFLEFWNIRSFQHGPTPLSFVKSVGGVEVLVTDGRTQRRTREGEERALFGAEQWMWIEGHFVKESAVPLVFVSGTPLLVTDNSRESLAQFPADEKRLFQLLKSSKRPVVLVSGDAHFGEINQVKLPESSIIELSASPLAAPVRSLDAIEMNKYRVRGPMVSELFGVLDICGAGAQTKFSAALFSRSTGEEVSYSWGGEHRLTNPLRIQADR